MWIYFSRLICHQCYNQIWSWFWLPNATGIHEHWTREGHISDRGSVPCSDLTSSGKMHRPTEKRSDLDPGTQTQSQTQTRPRHTCTYLYCWWSLVLRVFAMKRSASFSRFLEYSISISDFFLKKSCRSWRSCTLISVCWSRHFCCSTSWARISEDTDRHNQVRWMSRTTHTKVRGL